MSDILFERTAKFGGMGGRQIDLIFGAIHAKSDGFLGFLTRKVINQLNLYFAGHGILFIIDARCRPQPTQAIAANCPPCVVTQAADPDVSDALSGHVVFPTKSVRLNPEIQ
jgi:hypothetical protein